MATHPVLQRVSMAGALFLCSLGLPLLAQQSPAPQNSNNQPASQAPATAPSAAQSISKPDLPDSPGTTQQQQTSTPSEGMQQPSGTAAAQQGKISGSALSRPAGVAIAPTKQKRVRSILIKVGFIAGAGIALGTVAALSAASPSRPPGAP